MVARAFPPYPGEGATRAHPPIGSAARSRLIVPPPLSSWEDPNSCIQGFTWDGSWLEVTMQNPAAARDTPNAGGGFVLPITNFNGLSILTTLNAASIRHPILRFFDVMPADCVAHITLLAGTTLAGGVGLGISVVSDGVGMYARRNTPTSVAGSGTLDATMRYAMMNTASATTSFASIRGVACCAYATGLSGLFSSSYIDVTTTYGGGNANYVGVSFGWLAGTGVSGSKIKLRPSLFAGVLQQLGGI